MSSPAHNQTQLDEVDQAFEATLKKHSKRAMQFEYQMKDFESKLVENLSNFRAVDGLLQEAFTGLQRGTRRAERSLNSDVPLIISELDESNDSLTRLSEGLPTIQKQVSDIRLVYDSGREKAQTLTQQLTWLDTDWYERFRVVIFTPHSPVSTRWKLIMRCLFVVTFVMCSWVVWLAFRGVVRAHRFRLVWGDRLMS